jgi:3'-phosphoadenosine 5'-phosphosulfate sulfotransferase (PAPS reductase)/FAD synthetase
VPKAAALYSLRMQNAVLIKLAVQDMFNAVSFASMVKINEEDYVQLMREKVEEFRLVFVDWIRSFDKTYDIPDNWAIRFDTSTPEQEKPGRPDV